MKLNFWLEYQFLFNIQENKNALVVDMGRVNGQSDLVKYGNSEIGNERSGYQLRAADEFTDDECGARNGNSLAGSIFGDQGYGQADRVSSMVVNTAQTILPLVNGMMVSCGTHGLKTNGKLLSKLKWLLVKTRVPCFSVCDGSSGNVGGGNVGDYDDYNSEYAYSYQ